MRIVNLVLFMLAAVLVAVDPALASEAAAEAAPKGWADFAPALAIGLAVCAGVFAQARTASTALEGSGRNSGASGQMFVPMILGLVLIESLVIYALVVAILLMFS